MKEKIREKEFPRCVDFLILAPTTEERDGTKDVIKFDHKCFFAADIGDCFWTYYKPRGKGKDKVVSVVLVTQGEDYGQERAQTITRQLVGELFPRNLLVVGHALGISRVEEDSPQIRSGDVVVSYFLHVTNFYSEDKNHKQEQFNPLRPIKVLPPSRQFVTIASALESDKKKSRKYKVVVDKEIISGNIQMKNPRNKMLLGIVNTHPRIVAYEMEAGGVAQSLTDFHNCGERAPEYLIVKGISDCYSYKKQDGSYKFFKSDAKGPNRRKAIERSAQFVKEIIENYIDLPSLRTPTSIHKYRAKLGLVNKDCNGVLHKVDTSQLSKIIKFNVENSLAERKGRSGKHYIFTVNALEPVEWWEMINYLYKKKEHVKDDADKEKRTRKLIDLSMEFYPHLKLFGDHSGSCRRILLMKDRDYETRNKPYHWGLFRALNCGVDCYMLFRDEVSKREDTFLTDFTVIDGLVLDYYYDSNTLIITYPMSKEIKDYLLDLPQSFYEPKKNPKKFEHLTKKRLLELSNNTRGSGT